jgi:hypothetical protein
MQIVQVIQILSQHGSHNTLPPLNGIIRSLKELSLDAASGAKQVALSVQGVHNQTQPGTPIANRVLA